MSAQPTGRGINVGARATQWSPLRCQGDVYYEFYLGCRRDRACPCPRALNRTFCVSIDNRDGEYTSVHQKVHMYLKARDNMNNMNTMCLTASGKRSFLCRTDKDFVDR